MEGSKPTVPWGVPRAIVAVDEAVMQLVKKITQRQLFLAKTHMLKSSVADWRADTVVHEQKNGVHWMGRDKEEYHGIKEQEKAFARMHGQTGPGAGVNVFVMPAVDVAVEPADVEQSVKAVEMDAGPDGHCNDHGNEPNGIAFKRDHWGDSFGIAPKY